MVNKRGGVIISRKVYDLAFASLGGQILKEILNELGCKVIIFAE